MLFRFTRVRLKAEWLLPAAAAALLILYTWCSGFNLRGSIMGSYPYFSYTFDDFSPKAAAESLGLEEPPEGADLRDVYEAYQAETRGIRYASILLDTERVSFILLDFLAAFLLGSLFRKRRMGQFLSAGYSRGQIFLSLTLTYYLWVILMWWAASSFLLARFHLSFAPEEGEFFRTTQLAWFCNVLFNASLAYLAFLLLCRPLPAFLAALGAWILLKSVSPPMSSSPLVILGVKKTIGEPDPWEPGMDLSSLIAGNWITLVFFLAVLAAAWLSFRKREFP